jgi:hypothetical protein
MDNTEESFVILYHDDDDDDDNNNNNNNNNFLKQLFDYINPVDLFPSYIPVLYDYKFSAL